LGDDLRRRSCGNDDAKSPNETENDNGLNIKKNHPPEPTPVVVKADLPIPKLTSAKRILEKEKPFRRISGMHC
jgi:hypothetical protein